MRIDNPQLRSLLKTPERKTYTIAGITAITIGIFIFFSLKPTLEKIAELRGEINEKRNFLESVQSKLVTVNNLITQKQEISQELPFFNSVFPDEKKSGFITANLAEMASRDKVILISVEFDSKTKPERIFLDEVGIVNTTVERVNISIEGEMSDIENYIKDLESFPMIMNIESFSFSKNDLGKYKGDLDLFKTYNCSLTIDYYYLLEFISEENQEEIPLEESI